MDDKVSGSMIEAGKRRKRVKRLKRMIVWTVTCWILASIIICICLVLRVSGLNHRIDNLMNYFEDSSGGTASGNSKIENQNSVVSNPVMEDYDTDTYTQYASDDDNVAVAGEAQKVYFTFDDGPSDNTDEILDVLAKYHVKATFFVVGKTDEHSKQMYKRIVDEGHTLGLHSYSHKYSVIYQSLNSYKKDLTKLSDLLYDVTGVRSKYVRFPGGSSNQVSNGDMKEFIAYLNKEGYTYYDWNVMSGDATSQAYTTDDLVSNVMDEVVKYQTSVVLMHDASNKQSTVDALDILIPKLLKKDMQILPIDEETKVIQHVQLKTNND